MLRDDLLPPEIVEVGFQVPEEYYQVWELGLTRLNPWFLLDLSGIEHNYDSLRGDYPNRLYLPFARDLRDDDVACFVVKAEGHASGQVVIVHDSRPEGFEVVREFSGFHDWFAVALQDLLENLRLGRPPDAWVRQTERIR